MCLCMFCGCDLENTLQTQYALAIVTPLLLNSVWDLLEALHVYGYLFSVVP